MKNVQILGTGCRKCSQLQSRTEEAIEKLGVEATVEKIQDIGEIARFGVFMTPALVVDGQLQAEGRIPTRHEIEKMLG